MINTEEEVWKAVVGFDGAYEVSNKGRVRSLDRYRTTKSGKQSFVKGSGILSQRNKRGYREVELSYNGNGKNHMVHRLVCKAFYDNPENKPQVNHINGIKHDNNVENLEWVTAKENMDHAIRTGLATNPTKGHFLSNHPNARGVDVYEVCIRKIKSFDCLAEAEIELGEHGIGYRAKTNPQRLGCLYFTYLDELKTKEGDILVWADVLKQRK